MSTWTKDKPTTGKWWVSLAPTRRVHNQYSELFPALVRCNVRNEAGQTQVQFPPISLWHSADLPIFEGALWMRNDDPADPFAEQPRGNSRYDDLP